MSACVAALTCPSWECNDVFEAVIVDRTKRQGSRIRWELQPSFYDPLPYAFQLEVSEVGGQPDGAWTAVGAPVQNAFHAVDSGIRDLGTLSLCYYRVKLTTAKGVYYSGPVPAAGALRRSDWLTISYIQRREKNATIKGLRAEGWVLKRRLTGRKCSTCYDENAGAARNPNCPECFGTGFRCGYYAPIGCVWFDNQPRRTDFKVDATSTGQAGVVEATGRMPALPTISERDVFVNSVTDDRWYIEILGATIEHRGLPVVWSVKLTLAPASDACYAVDVPEQLDAAA
jgi:hypothetical protein